ncbi:MAG: T9SS type A sorting domain-containing protein [Bacteroidales bacterium]|nr:T9SS type A sorting domain-containing protein [Bacteroidales bacterium]MCF8456665.1 T9SS type A sorting domain-containing protein [Bacteroidales bacterium]
MKKVYKIMFCSALIIFAFQTSWSQKDNLTLNFSAEHGTSAIIIPLDSVHIENLASGSDTTIYGATPSITFNYLGLGDGLTADENKQIKLCAYPNPFTNSSRIELVVPELGNYDIVLSNSLGQIERMDSKSLSKGTYTLQLSLNSKGVYHCTVSNQKLTASIKLINFEKQSGASQPLVLNEGSPKAKNIAALTNLKSANSINTFEFSLGDALKIHAYKYGYDVDTITLSLTASQTYTFEMTPTAACPAIMYDPDGNEYATTVIDGKCWMAENMKTTTFFDGTAIPLVDVPSAWAGLGANPGHCYYQNTVANGDTYGFMYNWATAMHGAPSSATDPSNVQGICPVGWHVPSDVEWDALGAFIAGDNGGNPSGYTFTDGNWLKVGKHLKATTDWVSPGTGTDDYGFAGLPGGRRTYSGSFTELGQFTYFWSATQVNSTNTYSWGLEVASQKFLRNTTTNKSSGNYVRCMRD